MIFRKARESVREKTGGHYPAPLAAIDVVEEGTAAPLARGLEIEARQFGALAVSDVSRALVSVFLATQEIKKDAGYPEGTQPREVRKLAVVGAGLMGAGIATAAADAGAAGAPEGHHVRGARRAGCATPATSSSSAGKRGSLTRLELEQRMNRLSATIDTSGFGRADLVIEAVFEDLELKRRVLAEVEEAAGDDCVVASNTSSIPIAELARGGAPPVAASWACTSSRRWRRCRCWRSSSRRTPTPGRPPPRWPSAAGSASTSSSCATGRGSTPRARSRPT